MLENSDKSTIVGLVFFEQADLMDIIAPYEVLLTANRLSARGNNPEPFVIKTVNLGPSPCKCYGGLSVSTSDSVSTVGLCDLIVVPGAIDLTALLENKKVIEFVRFQAKSGAVITSVCTGAFLLAKSGLLEDKAFTTHWEDVDDLSKLLNSSNAVTDRAWVDEGDVITSGGITRGIDMSIYLVKRFVDEALALAVARQIDYQWDPSGYRAN